MSVSQDPLDDFIDHSVSNELSSNRTSLALARTRMAADRTLMAIVRTALSLIGFGFTLNKVFTELAEKGILADADLAARRLGGGLLFLGLLLLVMGIGSHWHFGHELTKRRARLVELHLLHTPLKYHATPTFIMAFLLLVMGLAALGSIIFRTTSGAP